MLMQYIVASLILPSSVERIDNMVWAVDGTVQAEAVSNLLRKFFIAAGIQTSHNLKM